MRFIIILILLISLSACRSGVAPAVEPVETALFTQTAPSPVVTPSSVPTHPLADSRPTPVPLTKAGFRVMQANGLAIARHIAYVTSWEGLHLLDISDPATPYQLGFYPTPNQSAAGVTVAGNRAYVMAIGLHIVDVSNPTAPRRIGFYQPPPSPISAPAVAGNTVYLAAWDTGLIAVDVSDPAVPREANRVAAQEARWVSVANSRAYLVDRSGVRILDISNPAQPHQLGLYRVNDAQRAVVAPAPGSPAVTLAYVIADGTIYIVDVSEPTLLKELGAYAPPGGAFSLAVSQNTAYIATAGLSSSYNGGLNMVDVSNPATPRPLAHFVEEADPWRGEGGQVALYEAAGRTAVYAVSGFGWSLFAFPDVQNLIAPVSGSELQAGGRLQSLPVAGVVVESSRTYTDPDLEFSFNYGPSWQLETRTGTDLNDGSGRTILLQNEGYQFKLQLQPKPDVVGECGGVLTEADLPRYWKYPLGQFEVWRAKAEAGWVNSFHHDQVSFIDIIVPTELRDEADTNGEIGMYNCSPQINDHIVNISYQLPVSVEDLKTGHFKSERLAEMDYILTSLAWK